MLRQDNKYLDPSDFATFSVCVTLAGLIYSPFLLSVGMWLLALAAVWHQFLNSAFERWNTMMPIPQLFWSACRRIWRNYTRQPVYWSLGLLFLVPALSCIWSEQHDFWLTNTRVRIPFVTLPMTFANLPSFNRRQQRAIAIFFLTVIVVTCMGIGIHFLLNQEAMLELIRIGKPIPVPRSHIRFSLSVAFAVLLGVYCLRQMLLHKEARAWSFSAGQKIGLGLATVFLFGFIHFLAVRSGIIAVYLGLATFFCAISVATKKYWSLLVLFGIVGLFGFAAIKLFPSLAQKISYVQWDLDQYRQGNGGSYSDSGRIASLEAGWKLFKQNPLLGTGIGDLGAETERITLAAHPEFVGRVKLPHNQWLFIMASTGIVGLLASLFGTLYWLSIRHLRNSALFLGFQATALSSLLVEYTFETSIGAAFYLLGYCLMVFILKPDPSQASESVILERPVM